MKRESEEKQKEKEERRRRKEGEEKKERMVLLFSFFLTNTNLTLTTFTVIPFNPSSVKSYTGGYMPGDAHYGFDFDPSFFSLSENKVNE